MRFLAGIFILCVLTYVNGKIGTRMGSNCARYGINSLEPVLKGMKKMMENHKEEMKKFGCLEADGADRGMEQALNGIECLVINIAGPVLQSIMKADSPTKEEISETWLEVQKCDVYYSRDDLLNEDGTMNFDNFYQSLNYTGPGKDSELVRIMATECINDQRQKDELNGVPAEISMSGFMECFFTDIIEECYENRGESPGKMALSAHFYNSYYQSKCDTVELPPIVEDSLTQCLDNAFDSMASNFLQKVNTFTNIEFVDKEQFQNDLRVFLTSSPYTQLMGIGLQMGILLKKDAYQWALDAAKEYATCYYSKMGWMDENNTVYNGAEFMKFFYSLNWENWEAERDAMVGVMGRCFGSIFDESDGAMAMDKWFSTEVAKAFYKANEYCAKPGYTNVCGWNNKIGMLFDPSTSKQVTDRVIVIFKQLITDIKDTFMPMVQKKTETFEADVYDRVAFKEKDEELKSGEEEEEDEEQD